MKPTKPKRASWLRLLVASLLLVAAVVYGVLPFVVIARRELDVVADAAVWVLVAALLVEVAAVVCYTFLTQAVLSRSDRLGLGTQLRIDVTGLGASHMLPGGGATAAALRYELMTDAGVAPAPALTTAALQTTVSDLALVCCYGLGALMAVDEVVRHPALVITVVVGLAALAVAALAVWRLARGRTAPVVRRGSDSRWRAWLLRRWDQTTVQIAAFLRDADRTGPAVGFAVLNWLLDACCLWLCLYAFGFAMSPPLLLTAYGFANLLALVPLTPGGLGVVEGSLIPLLLAFGAPGSAAVLGALTWRVFQFWLPIPVALGTYVSLRLTRGPWSRPRARRGTP
jgi:uncharacterized protein (TIRG00374 family)